MAIKTQFYYPSSDGVHQINAIRWMPENGEYKGIVQIVHGMVEFVDRYDGFANFMCDNGYIVVGEDHLGHGGSVNSEDEWGYFGPADGFKLILKDINALHKQMVAEFPDLPYTLLGHSMGSFLARIYITQCKDRLDSAIIMGTGNTPPKIAKAGKKVASIIKAIKGDMHRSKLINNMAIGAYSKAIEGARTPCDWLSKDEAIVDAYMAEPRNTFIFTVSAYIELFKGLIFVGNPESAAKAPKDLPLLFVSGDQDPVGDMGKGVVAVYDMFKEAGCSDVTLKLYEGDRHEILNELDKETVYADILQWIEK